MFVDSHCHLADRVFAGDLPEVVARARASGVDTAMCILSADEPDEVARAPVVRQAWPGVFFSAGVHPHRAGPFAGRAADAVAAAGQAVREVAAVAVGEIGLDYHYDLAPRDVQREVFAGQVALAADLDRPVVIHTREAADDTYDVLREAGRGRVRGVMHCFTGTIEEARRALDIGFLISLAGIVTFPRAESLRDVARFVPDGELLVETDSPFLAPVPHRGKRNEPGWVVETVKLVAGVRGVEFEVFGAQTAATFAAWVGGGPAASGPPAAGASR